LSREELRSPLFSTVLLDSDENTMSPLDFLFASKLLYEDRKSELCVRISAHHFHTELCRAAGKILMFCMVADFLMQVRQRYIMVQPGIFRMYSLLCMAVSIAFAIATVGERTTPPY